MALLSINEIALAANADVLLTKNRIIEAVYQLFGRLADAYRDGTELLSEPLKRQHPKISKGENYLGLPWVILDYPRNFSGAHIFAIRTLFWWGNHFSLQVLLQGHFLQMLNVTAMLHSGSRNKWFFCTGNTPWQHHFERDHMMPVGILTPEIIQKQKDEHSFFKIGTKLPVAEWEEAEAFLNSSFGEALTFLRSIAGDQ